MACSKVVILDQAKREFEEIVFYLAKILDSPQAALGFVKEFDEQVEAVRNNPKLYAISRMPELAAANRRVALLSSYLFIYTAEEDTVFIEHLFHQSQNYSQLI